MSDEEGDKENVGMVSGMSSVDVERVSKDGTTLNMSGDGSSEGEVNDRLAGSSRRHDSPEAQVERGTELDVNASSGRGFLSDSSEDSDATHRRRVKSKFSKRLSSRVVNKPSVPPVGESLLTNQNLQKPLQLASKLEDSGGVSLQSMLGKRKSEDKDVSDADSDPFQHKKERVKLDSHQLSYVNKVYKEWLLGKDTSKVFKECYPLGKGVTVTRSHDDWVLNMLDKSTKAKVVNEDMTLIRLSNKVHLATGPLFQAWALAEELGCKPVVKHIKKSVLALGQFQLTLNHERRMLSYGEICKDHGKAKEHLKEASDSFAKVAKKAEKPPLFGDKFKRAVIDRGTLSKQLKEARHQFEQPKPKFQPRLQKEPRYQSPLQRVQPEQQQANQSAPRTSYNQPFPSDPALVEGGMYQPSTTLVCTQDKELGCTVAQGSVLHAQLADSCQPELISCTLVEEFRGLPTPREFLNLGLLDFVAPDAVGGRVTLFLKNWEKVTRDPWVLSVVKNGYQIEWVQKPVQLRPPVQPTFNRELNALVDLEVTEMLAKGAIVTAQPVPGQYISTLFLVEKKGGGSRPVINLKRLNHLVKYEHFQMEGLGTLINLVQEGEFLSKLDLKDAYFTVPMHLRDRKYLRFQWRGKLYEFQVLPFSLSSAPRVFTRVMKAPIAFLRRLAFRNVVYLDDFCLTNSEGNARSKTLATAWFLSKLGYVINWKKSSVHPTQREEFLGFVIDTIQLMIFLPPEKVLKITALCVDLLEKRCCSLRTLASLIEKLQNASTANLPAPLHYRFMQMSSIKGLARNHQSYVASVDLTGPVLEELRWWVRNLRSWNGKSFINPDPQLDVVITTDASLSGWGAECQGITTQGQWSEEERTQHINVLELKAAELALKSFTHLWQGSRVRFRLDNTTAVSQILKMGSPRSLRCLVVTQEIWEHVLLHKSTAIAQHLPGKENVIADHQSRVFRDSSNWRLDPQVFAALRSLFPLIQVDLFADRLNHQLARYWSWRPDPHAEGVDALTTVWNFMTEYAFPSFRLVHRILRKVQDEKAELLLVAPVWGQQPWYPILLQMLTDQPVLIPMSQDLLKAPDGSLHPLCVNSRLVLTAWPVSGNPAEALAFRQKQELWWGKHGVQAPLGLIGQDGISCIAGVVEGRLILLRALWSQ